MPSPKSQRRVQEEIKNRRGRFGSERSSSFHGQTMAATSAATPQLRRPKTVPDMIMYRTAVGSTTPLMASPEMRPKLTKLLLNVTIQGSVGAVQVVMSPESTVGDLVAAAVRQYEKEGRRPIFPSVDPSRFDLHYSQFSLESLERAEKLMALGSRNFFLCPKKSAVDGGSCGGGITTSSCSKQAEKASKTGFSWLKFMDSLL
ncbi:uncharacterized protein LOC126787970 [Argentina anserina]|uniref:uncharacterized protein LOC126787970 n=1 Tax=Argentina anserina TaxID=57926 RepID=UPI0021766CBE|nr:uncharacterized protein LOC126787970 [Potentilla anserina]